MLADVRKEAGMGFQEQTPSYTVASLHSRQGLSLLCQTSVSGLSGTTQPQKWQVVGEGAECHGVCLQSQYSGV